MHISNLYKPPGVTASVSFCAQFPSKLQCPPHIHRTKQPLSALLSPYILTGLLSYLDTGKLSTGDNVCVLPGCSPMEAGWGTGEGSSKQGFQEEGVVKVVIMAKFCQGHYCSSPPHPAFTSKHLSTSRTTQDIIYSIISLCT